MKKIVFKIVLLILIGSCVKSKTTETKESFSENKKRYLDVSYSIHQDTIKLKLLNVSDDTLHYMVLLDGGDDSTGHLILYDIKSIKSHGMGFKFREYDSIKIEKNETQSIDFVLSDLKKEFGLDYLKSHSKFCLFYRILNRRYIRENSEDIVYFNIVYGDKLGIELLKEY